MYATDFIFDETALSSFGWIVCSFSGGGGFETIPNGGTIEFQTANPINGSTWNYFGYKYTEPMSATFQITKNPCISQEDITPTEISAIVRWLCRTDGYHKFKVLQAGYEDIFYMVNCTVSQVQFSGKCVGLEVTVTSNKPYGLLENEEQTFEIKGNTRIVLYNNSDKDEYIYPTVIITPTVAGDVVLYNVQLNETTVISDCVADEVITLDGTHMVAHSTKDVNLGKRFNYTFPKLANPQTDFDCEFTGQITIEYNPIISVGV